VSVWVAEIVVNRQEFARVTSGLDQFRRDAVAAGEEAVRIMAEGYAQNVRMRYAGAGGRVRGLKSSTTLKRSQGKLKGVSKAIPAFPDNRPLFQTGHLWQSVETIKTDKRGWIVRIRPGTRTLWGGRSNLVAAVHEFGHTFSFVATVRVRAYLRAVAMGIAGTNQPVPRGRLGDTQITVRVPARPVWLPAMLDVTAEQPFGPLGFATLFARELSIRSGFTIKMTRG
jgi:hypothetical protein